MLEKTWRAAISLKSGKIHDTRETRRTMSTIGQRPRKVFIRVQLPFPAARWRGAKQPPFHQRQKETTGDEERKKKNKERERKKKGKEREKATRSIVSRCQNNVDPFRRKNTPLVECKGWNNFSRTKKEEGGWNIARKLLFALEIIS